MTKTLMFFALFMVDVMAKSSLGLTKIFTILGVVLLVANLFILGILMLKRVVWIYCLETDQDLFDKEIELLQLKN